MALSFVTVCSLFSADCLQIAFDPVSTIKQPIRLKRYETLKSTKENINYHDQSVYIKQTIMVHVNHSWHFGWLQIFV